MSATYFLISSISWPLSGLTLQYLLFCGLTSHEILYRLLREIVADILADSVRRKRVLTKCDASDVLREAFTQTEASMDHYYEVLFLPALAQFVVFLFIINT